MGLRVIIFDVLFDDYHPYIDVNPMHESEVPVHGTDTGSASFQWPTLTGLQYRFKQPYISTHQLCSNFKCRFEGNRANSFLIFLFQCEFSPDPSPRRFFVPVYSFHRITAAKTHATAIETAISCNLSAIVILIVPVDHFLRRDSKLHFEMEPSKTKKSWGFSLFVFRSRGCTTNDY